MSNLTDFIGSGGGIKSIQRGETVGTATITITAVDTSKTFISSSFVSTGSFVAEAVGSVGSNGQYARGYGYGKAGGEVVLTNSTTLDITATDSNTTTSWEVIEYA